MTRRVLTAIAVACAIWLAADRAASAALGPPPSLDQLVSEAAAIYVGEVADAHPFWETHSQGRSIVTRVTVRVARTLKGPSVPFIALDFLGGTIGDVTLDVSDVPRFDRGNRDVLFVTSETHAISPLVGVAHGRFRVMRDAASGVEIVRNYAGLPLSAPSTSAALRAPLPLAGADLPLSEFMDEIARRVAAARNQR